MLIQLVLVVGVLILQHTGANLLVAAPLKYLETATDLKKRKGSFRAIGAYRRS
jgi:hypothetical protein